MTRWRTWTHRTLAALAAAALAIPVLAAPRGAAAPERERTAPPRAAPAQHWVAAWTGSVYGPYPVGFPVGQPPLSFALPGDRASDQTLRLVVTPSIGGRTWRARLSNVAGTEPLAIGHATVAVQASSANVVPGTTRPLRFGGRPSVTIPAGQDVLTDPVELDLADDAGAGLALVVSLHLPATTGPMTWHAAAFATSYLTAPGAGDRTRDVGDAAFPHSTTSWFYLDRLDVLAPRSTAAVVAFGDSITDGFFSSLNGNDRWPDALARRLRDAFGPRFSVVNAGIGGNAVTDLQRIENGCTACNGPPAHARLERDVLSQPAARWVIWLEGINDIGGADATADQVIAALQDGVARMHAAGLCVVGATLTPSTGTPFGHYGTATTDAERRKVNDWIRGSGTFDAVVDFDAATRDPANPGWLLPEYDTNSTVGGAGDHLHPNRAGFIAMADAFDLSRFAARCPAAR